MLKSCGWFALLMFVSVHAVADDALALPPLSSKKAAIYFFTLALAAIPTNAQEPSQSVSLQEFLSAPNDPIKTRVYLKSIVSEYWDVRMHLGRAMTGNAPQDIDGSLAARKRTLEDGIRELLAQLIHSKDDKRSMESWARHERISIPWHLAPKRLAAA